MTTQQLVIPVGPSKRREGSATVSGKTMLAQRMPGILPPLSRAESLETTRIYSALGLLADGVALMDERPVRTPHHSATAQALIGGGSVPKPGEVSLAHHGILFLDELPEFSRYVLEMLRQPLESGEVTVARVHGSIKFPARFMLVAAMNPTASGFASTDPRARDKYLASARVYDKVRRVARTIADIEGAAHIAEYHLAEAIQYRLLDRRS